MRAILLLLVLAALGTGGYFLYKNKFDVKKAAEEARKEIGGAVDEVRGYPEAKTPKEAADLFKKAIKERKYDKAAKYTTAKYAEMLNKGDDAARKLGVAIDNVSYQMQERAVLTDEMKLVFYGFDPFPKDINITVSNENEKDAVATLIPEGVKLTGQSSPYSTWQIDRGFWNALSGGAPPAGRVKIIKEGDVWKLDFPTSPKLQTSVARLNEKYKTYVQKLEILTKEIKNEADTKENVMRRMRELLEDAAKN
jgi:hypothetical protein